MRLLRLLWVLVWIAPCQGQNVLNWTSHASDKVVNTINAVTPSLYRSAVYVGNEDGVTLPVLISNMPLGNSSIYQPGFPGTPDNHAPYTAANYSECCSRGQADDALYYVSLLGVTGILTQPVAVQVGGQLSRIAPPTLEASVSSSNSGNGGTGWGVEFALSASYTPCPSLAGSYCTHAGTALDTSEDSWNSGDLAGLLGVFSDLHPTWNWFDIKGAFRQSAANWATGYDHTQFGYGAINWSAANALSLSGLYLQPPGMSIFNGGNYLQITLYPYRQTRRTVEALYSVNASYVWPVKNEYSTADITASGGTLLYTSNGTDTTPVFSYAPLVSGTVSLVAFTTDGAGHYSRVEEFSVQSAMVIVASSCTP